MTRVGDDCDGRTPYRLSQPHFTRLCAQHYVRNATHLAGSYGGQSFDESSDVVDSKPCRPLAACGESRFWRDRQDRSSVLD